VWWVLHRGKSNLGSISQGRPLGTVRGDQGGGGGGGGVIHRGGYIRVEERNDVFPSLLSRTKLEEKELERVLEGCEMV
jgi:hypothetical protein